MFLHGSLSANRAMDESCLHVSIYSPSRLSQSEKIPVMVFFHGGAYTSGGGDLGCYSGAALASRGVVVVSVTYRLGIFGYQPIDGIAPANLGLLDQIAALRWVQKNIHAFGGDNRRVCLFGESAGADSILCLLASDGVDGLFHRVILQSAPLRSRKVDDRGPLVSCLSMHTRRMLQMYGSHASSEDLLNIQSELVSIARSFSAGSMPFGPNFGYAPLPDSSEFDEKLDCALKIIPVLVGYTKEEGRAFVGMAERLQPLLRIPYLGNYLEVEIGSYITKKWFQQPAERLLQRVLALGGEAMLYEFSIAPDGSMAGAVHTMDLPFLLGTWHDWKTAPMMQGKDAMKLVSTFGPKVKDFWVAFARGTAHVQGRIAIDRSFSFKR